MNNMTILSVSNLSIGYATKKEKIVIAQNLNLNLQSGKLIALIGANGIGKSTLLRTLCGIQKVLLTPFQRVATAKKTTRNIE